MGQIWAFAIFAAILTVTPGLDTMLVLRTTAVAGRRSGLAAIAGIMLGCLVWAVVSALGVTAVLAASRLAFEVLRVAGVVYLCYLGAKALWVARQPAIESTVDVGRGFRTGLMTNLLNPKVGVFYLSVMPQFLPPTLNPLVGSLALAAIHLVEGWVWLGLLVLTVNRVRAWLTRPTVRRRLEQIAGIAFIGFGIRLALSD